MVVVYSAMMCQMVGGVLPSNTHVQALRTSDKNNMSIGFVILGDWYLVQCIGE